MKFILIAVKLACSKNVIAKNEFCCTVVRQTVPIFDTL